MARLECVSEWRIHARVSRVWSALSRYEALPSWWPNIASAEHLPDEEGKVIRYRLRGPIGLAIVFEQHIEIEQENELIQFHASGDLRGRGAWSFAEVAGGTTALFAWSVQLTRPSLRALAAVPGVMAMIAHGHRRAMELGRARLAARLADEERLLTRADSGVAIAPLPSVRVPQT